MRDDLPRMPREMDQQLKLLGRQVQSFSHHLGAVGCCIDHEIAGAYGRFRSLWSTPQMRSDPSKQFLNAEGLRHIIVRAGIERLDLRPLVIANGQHQDWR